MEQIISGNQGDLLSNSPSGSVYVNNVSYSGCDIKVVVNIYKTETTIQSELKELQQEEEKNAKEIERQQTLYSALEGLIETTKSDTPEFDRYMKQAAKASANQYKLEELQKALPEKRRVLEKGMPLQGVKTLAEVSTLSLSSNRSKVPVRSWTRTYPKGYARGERMIAGSLIFTVFDEHVLYQFLEAHATDFDGDSYTSALLDQLPPVDITILFANEYGSISRMAIYGVEFVTEGQTMSIEDIFTENVVQYVARDWDPMRKVVSRKIDQESRLMSEFNDYKASDLITEAEYQNAKTTLDPFERFYRRNNPFR